MNLEMPSPAETESLRKLLLIVLGVMIVTIPVIGLLVVAKIKARQRAWRPPGAPDSSRTGVPPVSAAEKPQSQEVTEETKRTQGAEGGQGSPDIRAGSSSSEGGPPVSHG